MYKRVGRKVHGGGGPVSLMTLIPRQPTRGVCLLVDRNSHSEPRPWQEPRQTLGALILHTALLMPHNILTGSAVYRHGLTEAGKRLPIKADL